VRQVAIIGAGFSGALLAINLLRYDGVRAILIERRSEAGRGTAYSTAHPEHLLNVRAANMSAFPDQPDHFVHWLQARTGLDGSNFAPRRLYGDYLEEMLRDAERAAPHRLRIIRGDAVDVETRGPVARVKLADGGSVDAEHVVLAIGNLPPGRPGELTGLDLDAPCYVEDPWQGDLGAGLTASDTVLVLGTGLTMVDVVLSLVARGFEGPIVALSRRGLIPHAHADGLPTAERRERPPVRPSSLVRALRKRSREVPWRAAIDELRPYTADLWRAMSVHERGRFLRHLRPWWDVHRHRIAPGVAAKLDSLRQSGRLTIIAGKIETATRDGSGLSFRVRVRGGEAIVEQRAARLINATGPQGALARAHEPILRSLRDRGVLREDPLGIGIDVDQDTRAIDSDGRTSPALHVIGPMTRGAFWEIVAVPDIRRQCWSLARRLSREHWVEGTGL